MQTEVTMKPRRFKIDTLSPIKISVDDQRYKWDNAMCNDNLSVADSQSLDSDQGRYGLNNQSMQFINSSS